MEGEMIFWGRIFYFCLFIVVGISVIGGIVLIEKGLSRSSWFRNILAVIAGLGASFVSLSIVRENGASVALHNPSSLRENSMTDEFNLSMLYLSILLLEIAGSMFGGYLGGKIARQHEIEYGCLIGIVFVVLAYSFGYGYFFVNPFNGLNFILLQTARVGSTVLGGYLALVQRKRNPANRTTTGET